MKTKYTSLGRYPSRGHHDPETIYRILDEAKICHIGYVHQGRPTVIPTTYGRSGQSVFLHASVKSRIMGHLDKVEICFTVSLLDGMVLARTGFDHSMNYRSVVAYGTPSRIDDRRAKIEALNCIIDHQLPGRSKELSEPSEDHLSPVVVFRLDLNEASAKIRNAGPGDAHKNLPEVWAGTVPMFTGYKKPIPDEELDQHVPLPESVLRLLKS